MPSVPPLALVDCRGEPPGARSATAMLPLSSSKLVRSHGPHQELRWSLSQTITVAASVPAPDRALTGCLQHHHPNNASLEPAWIYLLRPAATSILPQRRTSNHKCKPHWYGDDVT
jgi:hypothetical protein